MGGSDGCRNDILLIVWEYDILAVRVSGTQGPQEIRVRGTLGLQTGPRCMGTTIRSYISSPSASVNNPRLAYIWMYVCWGIHQDTYLDIWVRRVIIINDACCDSCYDTCYAYDDSCYARYVFLLCTPDMPVMIPVMTPVMDSCYSCYACYVFWLWLLCNSGCMCLDYDDMR